MIPTYDEAEAFLYRQLPIYQRIGKKAFKPDLSRTLQLLEILDNPHRELKCIHIAGTNGKGSTAHALAAILQSAGYSVGLYTSPHLKHFTERIRISGAEIPQSDVVKFVNRISPHLASIEPSFFELTVAMAFDHFQRQETDINVIETGLGGRLDSTNVVDPVLSLITNIGWDHMDVLGNTLEAIAREKAGIIKPGKPVIFGGEPETVVSIMRGVADANGSQLHLPTDFPVDRGFLNGKRLFEFGSVPYQTDMLASYFLKNVPAIMKAVELLNDSGYVVGQVAVEKGLAAIIHETGLKGRFQVLDENPRVVADVSHNVDGLSRLFEQISLATNAKIHLIFGTVKDKDLGPILDIFPTGVKVYLTEAKVPRSLPVGELEQILRSRGKVPKGSYPNVNQALEVARKESDPGDTILITGSTFVVAELDGL